MASIMPMAPEGTVSFAPEPLVLPEVYSKWTFPVPMLHTAVIPAGAPLIVVNGQVIGYLGIVSEQLYVLPGTILQEDASASVRAAIKVWRKH